MKYNGIITLLVNGKPQVIHFSGEEDVFKEVILNTAPQSFDGFVLKFKAVYWDKPLSDRELGLMTQSQLKDLDKPRYEPKIKKDDKGRYLS